MLRFCCAVRRLATLRDMIDTDTEDLLTLPQAAALPPLRNIRTGRPANVSQLYRWSQTGARSVTGQRVKLEVVRVPASLRTSREAVRRFIARLNGRDAAAPTPAQLKRQHLAAEKELAAAGL